MPVAWSFTKSVTFTTPTYFNPAYARDPPANRHCGAHPTRKDTPASHLLPRRQTEEVLVVDQPVHPHERGGGASLTRAPAHLKSASST